MIYDYCRFYELLIKNQRQSLLIDWFNTVIKKTRFVSDHNLLIVLNGCCFIIKNISIKLIYIYDISACSLMNWLLF